jgi:hypothetical protein
MGEPSCYSLTRQPLIVFVAAGLRLSSVKWESFSLLGPAFGRIPKYVGHGCFPFVPSQDSEVGLFEPTLG